jgi:hypothetical protein
LKGKSFVFSAGIAKSSLHFCKFDVRGRDLQVEALQQDCLVFGWAIDASFTDRDAGSCAQHEVAQGDLLEFGEDLARFVAKAGTLAPQAQSFPEHLAACGKSRVLKGHDFSRAARR